MPNGLDAELERSLISRAGHHPGAFCELYQHYFPRIYAYVAYRVGRQQDAEDLVADIFLRAVEELDRFEYRGAGSFAAWLFRIARNHVADFHRQHQRGEEPLPLEELPDLQADALLPGNVVLQKEKFAHLRRLIGSLSPRRQKEKTREAQHLRPLRETTTQEKRLLQALAERHENESVYLQQFLEKVRERRQIEKERLWKFAEERTREEKHPRQFLEEK